MPSVQRPDWEYKVTGAIVQKGMHGNLITSLKLMSRDNKEIHAFYNGTDAALMTGAELFNVSLSLSKQDSVVFHILTSYMAMPPEDQAA